MPPQMTRQPANQYQQDLNGPIRWYRVNNVGATAIPAYGVMEVINSDSISYSVQTPTITGENSGILINSAAPLAVGDYGQGHNTWPAIVAFAGSCSFGEAVCGVVAGSCSLTPGIPGFFALSNTPIGGLINAAIDLNEGCSSYTITCLRRDSSKCSGTSLVTTTNWLVWNPPSCGFTVGDSVGLNCCTTTLGALNGTSDTTKVQRPLPPQILCEIQTSSSCGCGATTNYALLNSNASTVGTPTFGSGTGWIGEGNVCGNLLTINVASNSDSVHLNVILTGCFSGTKTTTLSCSPFSASVVIGSASACCCGAGSITLTLSQGNVA